MAVKNFSAGAVLTASDTNTYLANSGLVYVGGGAVTSSTPSVSVNNCFTSTYDAYRINLYDFNPVTAGQGLRMRLRSGSTDASGTDYYFAYTGIYVDGSSANTNASAATSLDAGMYSSTNSIIINYTVMDLFNPALATRTFINVNSSLYASQFGCRNGVAEHNLSTSYDGFTVFSNSGNIANLKYKIYGYRQA